MKGIRCSAGRLQSLLPVEDSHKPAVMNHHLTPSLLMFDLGPPPPLRERMSFV